MCAAQADLEKEEERSMKLAESLSTEEARAAKLRDDLAAEERRAGGLEAGLTAERQRASSLENDLKETTATATKLEVRRHGAVSAWFCMLRGGCRAQGSGCMYCSSDLRAVPSRGRLRRPAPSARLRGLVGVLYTAPENCET